MTSRLAAFRNLLLFFGVVAVLCLAGRLIEPVRWVGPLEWREVPIPPLPAEEEIDEAQVGKWWFGARDDRD